jgi:hypothetical protein
VTRLGDFSPIGRLIAVGGQFFKITEGVLFLGTTFSKVKGVHIF